MGVFTTIKRKEDKEDERTVNASEFVERLMKVQQEKTERTELPRTELPIK